MLLFLAEWADVEEMLLALNLMFCVWMAGCSVWCRAPECYVRHEYVAVLQKALLFLAESMKVG